MRGSAGPGRSASPSGVAPAAGAGLALLLLGLGALFLGGAVSGSALLPFWVLGTGLAILLAALVLTLLRWDPSPRVEPGARERPSPRPEATPFSLPTPSTSEVAPSATPAPVRPSPARSRPTVASSIPAQYASLTAAPPDAVPPDDGSDWEDDVSLPFSAGSHFGAWVGPVPTLGPAGPGDSARAPLEQEVEKLRERVRELEAPSDPATLGRAPTALVPASAIASRSLEPPAWTADGPRRMCTGCGTRLAGGMNDPLCWGCGRPLCSPCYWRTKDGGAAHTCPACFARNVGMGVSGGRGLTPPVARSPDPVGATATGPR
jgi:hypothetical protein